MKKILGYIIIIPILVGIVFGIYIAFSKQFKSYESDAKIENIFKNVQSKYAEITKFYTYGTSLNIEGTIEGIKKDNYEGIRAILTDGADYNKDYKLKAEFDDVGLNFKLEDGMNNGIDLEDLSANKYYIQIRLKANNSKDYKYYLLDNKTNYKDIEYYTLTKDDTNKKIKIKFDKQNYNNKDYNYLGLVVQDTELPEEVYDFVIDSSCGGTDSGKKYENYKEADITLDYGEKLKTALENKGYKVKLTRDSSNTANFTRDEYSENGRITIACKTKAKYMISLHLSGTKGSGVEVYVNDNCDLTLAKKIADNICNSTNMNYSNYNSYKRMDGVYVQNFNENEIKARSDTAVSKGYEPYNITTDTTKLFTIREVGGIATNAFVDGRDKSYSANKYWNSNTGIECYQIYLGYIKDDINTLLNEQEAYINAIANSFD